MSLGTATHLTAPDCWSSLIIATMTSSAPCIVFLIMSSVLCDKSLTPYILPHPGGVINLSPYTVAFASCLSSLALNGKCRLRWALSSVPTPPGSCRPYPLNLHNAPLSSSCHSPSGPLTSTSHSGIDFYSFCHPFLLISLKLFHYCITFQNGLHPRHNKAISWINMVMGLWEDSATYSESDIQAVQAGESVWVMVGQCHSCARDLVFNI